MMPAIAASVHYDYAAMLLMPAIIDSAIYCLHTLAAASDIRQIDITFTTPPPYARRRCSFFR